MINKSGHLDVGDGHKLYFEDWGNAEATPILSFHGGPGSNFSDSHKGHFDPNIHRVIFFDQRGCGQSTPFASTDSNTTEYTISDAEKLREYLQIPRWHVVGGSWGSALTLMYAIAHPDRVISMMIWGVYTMRQFEDDWVNEGYPRHFFPKEWARFISLVPEANRTDGNTVMQYYADQMREDDAETAEKYAYEWTLWESVLLSIDYDPNELEQEIMDDPKTLAIALLETHYFLNGCFVAPNYIYNNIDKIKDIPCRAVQGRFDMCTPPETALVLAEAYGEKYELQYVNSGHNRADPEMKTALSLIAKTHLV
ncbi:MAG: prolyl aminopeptidase [Patescibacteria group bacterium]